MTTYFDNPYEKDTPKYRAYEHLLSLVGDEEDFEIYEDNRIYPNGMTLVFYEDSLKEEEVDFVNVNVDDFWSYKE